MTISVQRLHHFTLHCAEDEVEELREFYESVLGLTVGSRPAFPVGGYWLYAGDEAVVHIVVVGKFESAAHSGFDHVALLCSDLAASRQRLADLHIPFEEAPVFERPLHQIHFRDPLGVKLELTFEIHNQA
jgi:catechol 2,3-dioxygenase-like lactoylglutathione lyase family enzyme